MLWSLKVFARESVEQCEEPEELPDALREPKWPERRVRETFVDQEVEKLKERASFVLGHFGASDRVSRISVLCKIKRSRYPNISVNVLTNQSCV